MCTCSIYLVVSRRRRKMSNEEETITFDLWLTTEHEAINRILVDILNADSSSDSIDLGLLGVLAEAVYEWSYYLFEFGLIFKIETLITGLLLSKTIAVMTDLLMINTDSFDRIFNLTNYFGESLKLFKNPFRGM